MNENQISGRLAWLSSALAVQRNNLANILLRLKDMGLRAGTSLALHRKFMRLLEQVATDKEKELDILNEIEAVEKHHLALRQRKLLRRASPEGRAKPVPFPKQDEEKPHRHGFLNLFTLLCLLSMSKNNNKNQRLGVD